MNDTFKHALNLNEMLLQRSETLDSTNWLTLYRKDKIEEKITYRELFSGSQRWAARLLDANVAPGDRVLIILPTERAFYEAFWGILASGAVPVPVYPPVNLSKLDDYLFQLEGITCDCDAAVLITNRLIAPILRRLKKNRIQILTPNGSGTKGPVIKVDRRPDDLALLQYTSGSTGKQKGVMLTHANLLANLEAIGKKMKPSPQDKAMSWLPLYHDMGLIGLMMGSIYFKGSLVAMSPIDFLRKPIRWIRILSEHRATISAAPNFAYNLVARKAKPKDLENLDLSSWRVALCGAEPIHPSTIENFCRRFETVGFRPEAFFPSYGLAENTLAVSFSRLNHVPTINYFDPVALETKDKAVLISKKEEGRGFVSLGKPLDTVEVQILGRDGQVNGKDTQGEVVVRGPSVMAGYYNQPEKTADTLHGGWLRTGDIGFMHEGRLYVSGRSKDIIIKAGRNYFAEDLEAAVALTPGIRPGGVCVFSIPDAERGVEQVVLLVEVAAKPDSKQLVALLRKKMVWATGCRPDIIQIIPPRSLPKTSSGKLQRFKARQLYLNASLENGRKVGTISNLLAYTRAVLKN